MSFSSIREMLQACQESRQPLYEVILESDLAESGLTRAESEAEMHRLWSVMRATSDGYCGADRSMSGFVGGDAAKVEQAAARGTLYASGYFASVMAEALKTAECNACMKRIVAAPTAGSCGVLPAVLLPLWRTGSADEEAVCRALYVAAGFGQVVASRATLAGAEGGCQAEVGRRQRHGRRSPRRLKGRHGRAVCRSFRYGPDQPRGPCLRPRCRPCRDSLRQAQCHRCDERCLRRRHGAGRGRRPHPRR